MEALFTKLRDEYRGYWRTFMFLVGWLVVPVLGHAQSTVVISEVFTGGGSAGATYKNDFVELYNTTGGAIGLNGYSLQYKPATTTGNYAVIPLGAVSIPAKGYLLIQLGGGTNGGSLPTPDVTANTALAVTGGRLALVSSTTALADGNPANATGVVDFVGYSNGTATVATYEGSGPAVGVASLVSIERKARASSTSATMGVGGDDANQGNGYDSNDNAFDFVTRSSPEPQNSAAAVEVLTPVVVYYNTKNTTGALNELGTYSSTPDGMGASPTSFSGAFQVFTIVGTATIQGDWVVSGQGSRVVVATNATFTVPATYNYTGLLDLNAGATLVAYNAAPALTYGNLDATSNVEFAQAGDYTVPVLSGSGYGNLILRNASKHLGVGTTVVRGNLLVNNVGGSDVFAGAPSAASNLALGGNLKLTGTVSFSSSTSDRFVLTATNTTTPQTLDGGGNTIRLYTLALQASQAGVSLASSSSNLELGSTAGGGYQLGSGTVLTVNANTLSFVAGGAATFSGTGALAVDATSNLVFDKNSASSFGGTAGNVTLNLTPGSTQLNNLTLNAVGSGSNASNTVTLPNNMTINGSLTIPSGTLGIASGRTLTINGLLDAQNGAFNAADASIVLGGTGNVSFMNFRSGAASQLRSFTMARPGQTLYLGSNITLSQALNVTAGVLATTNTLNLNGTVNTSSAGQMQCSATTDIYIAGSGPLGTLYFTDSGGALGNLSLNRPGQTLNVEGATLSIRFPTLTAGILHVGDNLSLNIAGPLVVADPAVARFAVTPTSSMSFTSYNNTTALVDIGSLAFVPGQDVMASLTMSRSAGTVNNPIASPTALLTTNLTVRTLILNRGSFYVTGTNRLSVIPGGAVVGGSATSYTNTLSMASVTNSNPVFATLGFPLGVNGEYRALTLSVTDAVTGTTTYTARQFEGSSPQRNLPTTLMRVSGIRYYNVVAEAGGSSTLQNATVKLSYDATNDQVSDPTLLRIAMTDPTDNTKWKDMGGNAGGANITTTNAILPGPLGDFTLATDGNAPTNVNPLPVELTAFTAQRLADKSVSVRWATASEKNSDRFEVQRSLDGRDFTTIATAQAQGSTTQATAYAALDRTAPAGQLYYRLRQVDLDGTQAFSTVVRVAGLDAPLELALYPNPATDRLTATAPALAARTYRVLNTLGQVLDQGSAEAENPAVDVRALPTGTYLLELSGPGGRQVRRFVKTN